MNNLNDKVATETSLVSVIIPVYNASKYIDDLILSLINQTYKNIEIVVVNDSSTDNSLDIINKWALKDHRINVINKDHNEGMSLARNTGLDACKGEYICFCDADDIVSSEYIYDLMLNINGCDLAVCQATRNISQINKQKEIKQDFTAFEYLDYMIDKDGYAWNKLYKKTVIDKYSLRFDGGVRLYEDELFNVEYLSHIEKVNMINKNLYYYRFIPDSMINTRELKKVNDKKMSGIYCKKMQFDKIFNLDCDMSIKSHAYTILVKVLCRNYIMCVLRKRIEYSKEIIDIYKSEKNKHIKICLKYWDFSTFCCFALFRIFSLSHYKVEL